MIKYENHKLTMSVNDLDELSTDVAAILTGALEIFSRHMGEGLAYERINLIAKIVTENNSALRKNFLTEKCAHVKP